MYKELAIIAPTASGKTDLSINLAHKLNAVILSLDSLAVYKEIDIASAKPTKEERDGIIHFGVDKVNPNEQFDVIEFIGEYKNAKEYVMQNNKNLIIVGGTGFYLKAMVDGLSKTPNISNRVKIEVVKRLSNLEKSYDFLNSLDNQYMKKIKPTDKYRIEKALEIYLETALAPTTFFEQNKPEPVIKDLKIFQIETKPEILRERIKKRTKIMLQNGIIDEVVSLEDKYTRKPNCMGSIGIKETLEYLDGRLTKIELEEQILNHTAQLAKRQRTFNKSQFCNIFSDELKNLENKILSMI
ncbi:MAG: tRNA (adenosine(37)-N6)-dimethylallyltransferase MiaA [Campylobacterota bacterium]|nr:tRNA (adenosine(37)-N6)-dimethylallyltransferase MiaA [Campylobacterota bacterium]